jgi:tRNA(fMet)-specific endonuclease VapC
VLEGLLAEIEILPTDVSAYDDYGKIRAELEAAGKPIASDDLLIAAHTMLNSRIC